MEYFDLSEEKNIAMLAFFLASLLFLYLAVRSKLDNRKLEYRIKNLKANQDDFLKQIDILKCYIDDKHVVYHPEMELNPLKEEVKDDYLVLIKYADLVYAYRSARDPLTITAKQFKRQLH